METVKTFYNNNVEVDVPLFCPYCGIATKSNIRGSSVYLNSSLGIINLTAFHVTCCNRIYTTTHLNKCGQFELLNFYPSTQPPNDTPQCFKEISPRFVNIYSQSLAAENQNHHNLAAIGYRTALEILIKDFAITQLQKPQSEVEKLSLFKAIETYLPNDLINTADVVRVLGNDNTHYSQKNEEYDFEVLKNYLSIFMKQLESQYMILNPPVSRQ